MDVLCRPPDTGAVTEARKAVAPVSAAARELDAALLQGPLGMVLADHLVAFARELPAMEQADAPAVARATAALISACIAANGGQGERAPETSAGQRIRRYIDDNLQSEDLTPARICAAVGVSRSTLNRALAAEGGVAACIRLRRLDAIRVLLEDAAERRSIADIAYGFGFVSDAHFSRCFRRHFGYSPSAARTQRIAPEPSAGPSPAANERAPSAEGVGRVPTYAVDLAKLRPQDREAAWRAANGAHFEMRELPHAVEGCGRAWDLGLMVLTDAVHPRQTFVRDQARARKDGVDHILVSLELTTGFQMETARGQEMVPAHRVTLFDISRPVTKLAFAGRTLCLAMSRDLVEEVLPGADVHGLTLGRLGGLMAGHLKSLAAHGAGMELSAMPPLTLATAQLLAACVRPSARSLELAGPTLSQLLLQRARRYVRANCCDPELSPDKVADRIGASRTALYRVFQPKSGISEYIRLSRLDAARAALIDRSDPRRISEIAYAHGFHSEAQFSRAMRAAFGATPSELRHERHDFRSGYAPEIWAQRHWSDESLATPAAGPAAAVGAPAWRPGAAAAIARALSEDRAA